MPLTTIQLVSFYNIFKGVPLSLFHIKPNKIIQTYNNLSYIWEKTIWGWKRWILVEPDGETEKTIPSHGRVIQTLALFEELGRKRTKSVILMLCVPAMFLDTKYSICVSSKYVINEKQSYLTDVVKACHTYGKLPPICDFSLVPNHLWQ